MASTQRYARIVSERHERQRAAHVPPNGQRVVFDLLNIVRFDDQGRLVEEFVQTDFRGFLQQLGAPGK